MLAYIHSYFSDAGSRPGHPRFSYSCKQAAGRAFSFLLLFARGSSTHVLVYLFECSVVFIFSYFYQWTSNWPRVDFHIWTWFDLIWINTAPRSLQSCTADGWVSDQRLISGSYISQNFVKMLAFFIWHHPPVGFDSAEKSGSVLNPVLLFKFQDRVLHW